MTLYSCNKVIDAVHVSEIKPLKHLVEIKKLNICKLCM